MKKKLYTHFNTRQYMTAETFEIFYYKDIYLESVSCHKHDYYEIYLFLEGDVSYQIDKQIYYLQVGDILIIPPNKLHGPILGSNSVPYRRFIVWLQKSYYKSLCRLSKDFSYAFDYALETNNYHFHLQTINYHQIQAELLNLLEKQNSSHPFKETTLNLLLASFVMHINELVYSLVHLISPDYSKVLYLNVCDYINHHLEDDLSLNLLSSFFYVSKYHIAHTFKENMGISVYQYIQKKRLHASKNGILSGISFQTISQLYGFSDYSSFYRAFKKEFGVSPSALKKQYPFPQANPKI